MTVWPQTNFCIKHNWMLYHLHTHTHCLNSSPISHRPDRRPKKIQIYRYKAEKGISNHGVFVQRNFPTPALSLWLWNAKSIELTTLHKLSNCSSFPNLDWSWMGLLTVYLADLRYFPGSLKPSLVDRCRTLHFDTQNLVLGCRMCSQAVSQWCGIHSVEWTMS